MTWRVGDDHDERKYLMCTFRNSYNTSMFGFAVSGLLILVHVGIFDHDHARATLVLCFVCVSFFTRYYLHTWLDEGHAQVYASRLLTCFGGVLLSVCYTLFRPQGHMPFGPASSLSFICGGVVFGFMIVYTWLAGLDVAHIQAFNVMIIGITFVCPAETELGTYEPLVPIAAAGLGNIIGYSFESLRRTNFLLELAREKEAKARLHADSKLYHIMKGKCGAANAFVADLSTLLAKRLHPVPGEFTERLQQVHTLLEQAESWCHKREFFLQIEQGTYQTVCTICGVGKLLRHILGTRGNIVGATPVVCCDVSVLSIAVEEALSNACKYSAVGTPITARAAFEEGQLHVTLVNANASGLLLSNEELAAVFEPGWRGTNSAATSNGLGLSSVVQAVGAVGGSALLQAASISMVPHTIFHVWLPGRDARQLHGGGGSGGDDLSHPEAKQPTAILETEGDDLGLLVCVGIDDEEIARCVQRMLFSSYIQADMRRSCVLGATREEQGAFVDVALGLCGVQLGLIHSGQQADLVLLDDNIDFDGQEHLNSQEVAHNLRERGFHGVVSIMSASSNQRLTELRETDGIDLVFSKNTPPILIATRLRCAVAGRRKVAGGRCFSDREALAASSIGLPRQPKSGGWGDDAWPRSLSSSFGEDAQLQVKTRVGVREVNSADLRSLAGHQRNVDTVEMNNKERGTQEENVEKTSPKDDFGIGDGVTAAVEDLITMVPTEVADLRTALEHLGGYHSLLHKFVRHVCTQSTAPLVVALDAGDLPTVRHQAHSLGGIVSYVCAHSLLATCQELATFRGEDEGVGRQLAQTLLDEFEKLKASFVLLKPLSGLTEPDRPTTPTPLAA